MQINLLTGTKGKETINNDVFSLKKTGVTEKHALQSAIYVMTVEVTARSVIEFKSKQIAGITPRTSM